MIRPLLATFILFSVIACTKTEGPGGTSTITGEVKSINHEGARAEITEIIMTNGLPIEHGEYWVLNNPEGLPQYYIYYDNETWISEADPGLVGRTGISVSYNYGDSNVDIAMNTAEAVTAVAGDYFTIQRNVDVLTITHLNSGIVADADEINTPFEFNIATQGRNGSLETEIPAVDERVYLIYGNQEIYSETARTGGEGGFQFTGLTPGNYTLYVISKDTLIGGTMQLSQSVEITEKKSKVEAETFVIYN